MRQVGLVQRNAQKATLLDVARSSRVAPAPNQNPGHAARDTGLPLSGHDFSRIAVHSKSPATIQPKLTISTSEDIHELEADRVADQVMGMREGQKSVSEKADDDEEDVPPKVAAKKCAECAEDDEHVQRKGEALQCGSQAAPQLDPQVGARIQASRGGGRPLSLSERQFMEPRFGADFSAIRIHANDESDSQAREINARAFTLGSDIFFRSEEYKPGQAESRRLLAHELTHSIQQGAVTPLNAGVTMTSVPSLQRQPAPPPPPPPVVAPVVPPASVAAVNYLPFLAAVPTGSQWGLTKLGDIVVDITAYANGANWSCVVTKADQQTRQGVRLKPHVVEVTAASVAAEADCGTLKTMITSLNSVANQGVHSGFYMVAAVQAHETLHVTQYRAGLNPAFGTYKAAVEALTVPFASHANAGAAKTAIKGLAGYTTAAAALHTADVTANNKTAAHSPVAPFNAAEHAVVDPMVATITARRTTLKCPA